ncbi:MAG: hypothetical protein AB8G22_25430 [Saprospiraceae bacterium]
MEYFINTLQQRNESLFYFNIACVIGTLLCIILIWTTSVEVLGINAWIKPLKFFISTVVFVTAMAWYIGYLPAGRYLDYYAWTVILILGFELIYICWMAGTGELSHFNNRTPFHVFMFGLMGAAIGIMTIFTAYIGYQFFIHSFPDLPNYYVWAIRWGILLFVIFAFEGYLMGGNNAHTVGAADGGKGITFLNWSITHGDLRIAHFVGMHALQVLPILAFFVLKDTKLVFLATGIYAFVAGFVLWQALRGIPFFQLSS